MSEMKNFKIDFVKRTKKLLNNYYEMEENEVTMLLNCLLALITLPIEMEKDKSGESINKYKRNCVNKLKELKKEMKYKKMSYNDIFRNIRNAIAHLNIEPLPEDGKIKYISMWNINSRNIKNFSFIISVDNLKQFALFVADEYIVLLNENI